ncbi:hypothetical protein EDEG_00767 [Edhazardia aedis USNM 41457]|uniref:Uncharacterized protein n=1 Tax=Edhazardia aedis (strain USNM 41457) TaxID=1003232 RepID=J9DBQ5_EDHAE|nr:hypothetical protein EDEG_00767 [Edhazardia aedis USNM 41457]|eukprot:EJW05156.1 hypothetical protein EDEG_00767 [Edhazardia aedis USNM 41457]
MQQNQSEKNLKFKKILNIIFFIINSLYSCLYKESGFFSLLTFIFCVFAHPSFSWERLQDYNIDLLSKVLLELIETLFGYKPKRFVFICLLLINKLNDVRL